MGKWPEFNNRGDLPPGIYKATLTEIIDHFGKKTPRRIIISRRLERIYNLALETGHLSRFIIFGSFITSKPDPEDIDIFMIMDNDFDLNQLIGEKAIIFDHITAQNYEGASIFWIRKLAAIDGEKAAVEFWQLKRDGTKRGIVEVISND